MKRETIVFTVCGFVLGLVVGSFLIGPRLAQTSLGPSGGVANAAEPAASAGAPPMAQMNAVREQLAKLKEAVEKDPRLKMTTQYGPFMDVLFNGTKGPFSDARVRRAVAHAVRREDIVQAAFFGRGKVLEGDRKSVV